MKKKKLLSVLAIGAVISAVILSTNSVLADDAGFNNPLVQKIAEKFGLNEDDVEAVFDSVHEEHMQETQERKEDRLNQAAEDGVITEDQKNALLEKQQQMWQERNAERETHREEMDAWFSENGIDHEALMQYLGGGFGEHGFHHGGMGMWEAK